MFSFQEKTSASLEIQESEKLNVKKKEKVLSPRLSKHMQCIFY